MLKKKLFAGAVFALAMFVAVSVSAAYTFPNQIDTLQERKDVQTVLNTVMTPSPNLTVDGVFGPMTMSAVKAFQTSKGLVADGVIGPMTRAALEAAQVGSTTGGTTGGATCPNGNLLSNNCLPATGGTTTPTTLTGGAGTLDYSSTTSGLEDTMKEGEEDVKVLAFKAEADGSDIAVTSMKVVLKNDGYNAGDGSSEKLSNYVSDVKVMLGSTEVGSADASDFKRESGSPDEYSKTIALSGATVKDGEKLTFYVAVSADSSIDTEDMDDALWNVDVQTLRYNDATGAIMSDDLTADYDQNFSFEDVSTDDDMSIKVSSSNPSATTYPVELSDDSEEFLVGAFKLDVDEDSSDITVTEIPVVLTINDSANTANSDDAEDIIKEVTVDIDGTSYEAELDSETITNGDGTATYLVTIEDGDLVVDAGDDVTVKISVIFVEQNGQYGTGTTVVASVAGANIDAEGAEDEVTVTGTFTSKTHTLDVTGVTISKVSSSESYVPADQTIKGKYVLVFNVTNDGDDAMYMPFGAIYGAALTEGAAGDEEGISFVLEDSEGTAYDVSAFSTVSLEADDADVEGTDAFLIDAGQTEKFTLTVSVDNTGETAGSYRLRITDATVAEEDVEGDDADAIDVAQNFSTIRTNTLQLDAA